MQPLEIREQIYLPLLQHSDYNLSEQDSDQSIDLNQYLLQRTNDNSYCIAQGDEMSSMGIFNGDLLIVDRKATPQHRQVVIAVIDGELMCRQLDLNRCQLTTCDEASSSIQLSEHASCEILGVVIHSIHQV